MSNPLAHHGPLRTLLIDNYDSYTFNLYHLLAEVNGIEPVVVKNDEYPSLRQVFNELGNFDNIVISPGPGRPENDTDFGISRDAFDFQVGLRTPLDSKAEDEPRFQIPVLGVCLGYQGLCDHFGATVERCRSGVVHGRLSQLQHTQDGIFRTLPQDFLVVRYHSLHVDEHTIPECLRITAWTQKTEGRKTIAGGQHGSWQSHNRVIMGVEHKHLPLHGVQFHPESIGTQYGKTMISNFAQITRVYLLERTGHRLLNQVWNRNTVPIVDTGYSCLAGDMQIDPGHCEGREHGFQVHVKAFEPASSMRFMDRLSTERVFQRVFYHESSDQSSSISSFCPSFWLDSSSRDPKHKARFSIMGNAAGPHAELVKYSASDNQVVVHRPSSGSSHTYHESVFSYLDREMANRQSLQAVDILPHEFNGGYVGYFGYELKKCVYSGVLENKHASTVPDCLLIFADRFILFDHDTNRLYIICLYKSPEDLAWVTWVDGELRVLEGLPCQTPAVDRSGMSFSMASEPISFELERSEHEYLADIKDCLEEIEAGESYEICLTNRIRSHIQVADPLGFYTKLRVSNPAPYSCFLHIEEKLVICSCSPEQFLRINADGVVTSRPIKGTAPRGATEVEDELIKSELAKSVKDRAENLMIVDLVRNDLGKVCRVGTVEVPGFMQIESFSTVHQMVTTISGQLYSGVSRESSTSSDFRNNRLMAMADATAREQPLWATNAGLHLHRQFLSPTIHCIQSTFPMGSMTGAPKLRTLQIIDRLEHSARGVYSGCIGFVALSGASDLNVVIRTAVITDNCVEIGVGGAITALSDPEMEFHEILLKGKAICAAISKHISGCEAFVIRSGTKYHSTSTITSSDSSAYSSANK